MKTSAAGIASSLHRTRSRMPGLHGAGLVVAIALVGMLPLLAPNDFYLKIAFTAGVNYLVAAGLNVLVGYTGQKSLGHAGLFAVGAYTLALLTTQAGLNPWLAFFLALVMSGLFGTVIALPALRVKGASLAMVTIAFGIVIEKIATEWSDVFHGQQGIYAIPGLSFGGIPFNDRQWVWFIGALCLVVYVLFRWLLLGKFGRAFRAVEMGEIAAESVGINVYRFKVLAFVISGVTAGAAGALVAMQNQYINSDFVTFQVSIFFLLIVLFGGSGNLHGPLIGAVTLTLLDAWLARWPHIQHFVHGALFLFTLLFLPKGVGGFLRPYRRLVDETNLTGAADWHLPGDIASIPKTILQGVNLFKAYGGIVPTRNVDISVQRGDIHALIGPNGAGKTTLLNILSGVSRSDQGSIKFDDQDITGKPAHRITALGLGRTFQNLRLFADMSVLENVLVGLHPHLRSGFLSSLLALPASRSEESAAYAEAYLLLHFVGLSKLAYKPAASLPYGLQRRLEIARALATHPTLLLLDEPAAGLNPTETKELGQLILRIRAQHISVLLIEHHMDLVMSISDCVTVLDYGEKIAEGNPRQIQDDPRVIEAYLGMDDDSEASEEEASC